MYERITSLLKESSRPFAVGGPPIGRIAARAAGIREALQDLGAPADEPVCLCLEDCSHLLAALLAALAGAPPFILPHAFGPQTLGEAHEAAPFRFILAEAAVEPPAGATVVPIEACPPSAAPLTLVRHPGRPFLRLFTGGSTGRPKLWSKTPENLFGEALHLARAFGVGPEDLIVPTVGPRHIYGLLGSVLLPFIAPARVLGRTCTFPREILGALHREGATVLLSVPAHYRALLAAEPERNTLKLALSSAAPLDPGDAAAFLEKTGLAITEIYGSTETGGIATRTCGENHGSWEPFACLDWKIREERLCVRSPFVSPDLPRDGEGFFVTADRVEGDGESRFRFLGRADNIVKIAGKRVDLAEVREKIRRIPGVMDAYVTTLPLKGARQTEIAALVASDRPAREIRSALRSLDDPYGRPRRIRIVRAIPVLPSGKIDRERVEKLLAAPHRPKATESLTDGAHPRPAPNP